MKQYLIMQKNKEYEIYKFIGSKNWRFSQLIQLFSDKFESNYLIDWLFDEKKTSTGNDWVSIDKERGAIALYDVSSWMDETYTGEYLDPEKRFEMTIKNFAEILVQWEELRVSMPDIILIVIHEDNHVSLETDLVIIKEYQDANYAFDIQKK